MHETSFHKSKLCPFVDRRKPRTHFNEMNALFFHQMIHQSDCIATRARKTAHLIHQHGVGLSPAASHLFNEPVELLSRKIWFCALVGSAKAPRSDSLNLAHTLRWLLSGGWWTSCFQIVPLNWPVCRTRRLCFLQPKLLLFWCTDQRNQVFSSPNDLYKINDNA